MAFFRLVPRVLVEPESGCNDSRGRRFVAGFLTTQLKKYHPAKPERGVRAEGIGPPGERGNGPPVKSLLRRGRCRTSSSQYRVESICLRSGPHRKIFQRSIPFSKGHGFPPFPEMIS